MTGTFALVMAGGRGARMRASGGDVAKPLVPVRGVPLLERCLWSLATIDCEQLAISVARDDSVAHWARDRGMVVARALGAHGEVLAEDRPLGNVGAAGLLAGRASEVLVLYADNLTAIPLAGLLAAHRARPCALTLAVHREPFALPYGEVEVEDGRVRAYREKPVREVPVSSAVFVLGGPALARLADGRAWGISDLARALLDAGEEVRAFEHAAPWVDVNDLAAVRRAEELLRVHAASFERWASRPAEARALWMVRSGTRVLVERGSGAGAWRLPARPAADDAAAAAAAGAMAGAAGAPLMPCGEPLVLDDVDSVGTVVRARAFVRDLGPADAFPAASGWSWLDLGQAVEDPEAARWLARAGVALP